MDGLAKQGLFIIPMSVALQISSHFSKLARDIVHTLPRPTPSPNPLVPSLLGDDSGGFAVFFDGDGE
jgi:hypothetical protein